MLKLAIKFLEGRADQVTRPREFVDRPLDAAYLLDQLSRLSQTELALQGRMDLDHVGVVGQSFGGYTALALAGATPQPGQLATVCQTLEDSLNVSLLLQCLALQLPQSQYDLPDSRIKAAIAINPVDSRILGQAGLSQINISVMVVSSSADTIAPALLERTVQSAQRGSGSPIFGMIQRGGQVVIRMLENVQHQTIEPLVKATMAIGSLIYTDEYGIYNLLPDWGYEYKTVCHGAGDMHETTMAMAFVKSMSTRWRGFGHSCTHGYVPIAGSLRKSCSCT